MKSSRSWRWGGQASRTASYFLAAEQFECFLTVDANIEKQQHLPAIPVAVLLVRAVSNDPVTITALAPAIVEALASIKPRTFVTVAA